MVWWEIVFMLVILKIPIVYLCCVVWWAIKAEPRPAEGAVLVVADDLGDGPGWWRPPRSRRRPGPHGSPVRGYRRTRGPAFARARVAR